MNRITQILTKYRIALYKPGVESDDEQIDILTEEAYKEIVKELESMKGTSESNHQG